MATFIVSGILLVIVVLIIRKLVKDKKNGIGSCGHSCSTCPHHGACSGGIEK